MVLTKSNVMPYDLPEGEGITPQHVPSGSMATVGDVVTQLGPQSTSPVAPPEFVAGFEGRPVAKKGK